MMPKKCPRCKEPGGYINCPKCHKPRPVFREVPPIPPEILEILRAAKNAKRPAE